MRSQDSWPAHAGFMNDLTGDGFVVKGGPIGDGERVLPIVVARDADEVRGRLVGDPSEASGVLGTQSVEPWTVLLGE